MFNVISGGKNYLVICKSLLICLKILGAKIEEYHEFSSKFRRNNVNKYSIFAFTWGADDF